MLIIIGFELLALKYDTKHCFSKGSSKIVIIFKRVHRVRWGEWVNGRCTLFKNVDYDALHMHTGSLKINIFKVLFWEGGGHIKEYSVYAFDNFDNYGRPLTRMVEFDLHELLHFYSQSRLRRAIATACANPHSSERIIARADP